MPEGRVSRVTYFDGIRGLAIAFVLVEHGWYAYGFQATETVRHSLWFRLLDPILSRGNLGVQLFFVLSGLCLAYPMLKRRADGKADWFVPSTFFARRCLRILPPYYAAVFLFLAAQFLASRVHLQRLRGVDHITLQDVLSHIALVHNLDHGFAYSINSSFWTLGLEWQWYFLFPLLLLVSILPIRHAVTACLLVCLALFLASDTLLYHANWSFLAAAPVIYLPVFGLGIAVAHLLISGKRVPTSLLLLGCVLPIVCVEILMQRYGQTLPYDLGYGIAFASLAWLGGSSETARAVLSWRPLVSLGIISYSVYLLHQPIIDFIGALSRAHLHASWLSIPLGIGTALAISIPFHIVIERPCMRRETWQRVGPALTRLFVWADVLLLRLREVGRLTGDVSGDAAPVAVSLPAEM